MSQFLTITKKDPQWISLSTYGTQEPSMTTHVPFRFLHAVETGTVHNFEPLVALLLTSLTNLNFLTYLSCITQPERGRCPASCQDILVLPSRHLKLPSLRNYNPCIWSLSAMTSKFKDRIKRTGLSTPRQICPQHNHGKRYSTVCKGYGQKDCT